jgi:hypothetical protein
LTFAFDPWRGLIILRVELAGPSGSGVLQLALDTGATTTLINVAMLVAMGYDPGLSADRVQITTGSGVEFAPRVELQRLTALGQERYGLQVLGHTLPPSREVDGLPGLDFFRGLSLSLDFRVVNCDLKPSTGRENFARPGAPHPARSGAHSGNANAKLLHARL